MPGIKSQHVAHDIFCENKKQRMLFGAATDAIWDILIFCEKNIGCFVCVCGRGVGDSRSMPVRMGWCLDLPERLKIPERLRNTGTTTEIRRRKNQLVVVMMGEGV